MTEPKRENEKQHQSSFSVQHHVGKGGKQSLSDQEIWVSYQKGDEAAFNYIYETYFPLLFNYGHQFTSDRELVKDLIQDLFIELREKKDSLHISFLKFYLLKSLKRKLMAVLSSKKWKQSLGLGEKEEGFEIMLSHESLLIKNQIEADVKEKLEKAFQSLSKRQKEVILYYYYEGFSYQQITELMGFSKIEHARVLVSRAIGKLKSEMDRYKMRLFEIMVLLGISLDYLLTLGIQ
jgi:RNA polymerase sigma factor (sigma-70 family)